MNIRALFFDIDGTLVGRDKKPSASTLQALHMAREKGVKIFVATGRPTEMAVQLRDIFDFDAILCMTGQYALDRENKLIYDLPLDKDDIRLMMQIHEKDPFPCLVVEGERCFTTMQTEFMREHWAKFDLPIPKLYDISRIEEHDVYQLITYDPETSNPKLAPLHHIRITNAATFCHDVIPENGGKHVGIRNVAALYGIEKDEIMVFGDGKNDVDMLTHAGFGVAMGNACPEAKAAADYITDDVDEDGVFNALRHFGVI